MTLAWSMDKLGPITRSVEDCAPRVRRDPRRRRARFRRRRPAVRLAAPAGSREINVGYIEKQRAPDRKREELKILPEARLRAGPDDSARRASVGAITLMLGTEAAAAFDELTRKHVTEGLNTWPDTFRQGQFVPAVEYLRAARVRTKLMQAMARTDGEGRPLRQLRPGPGDHEFDGPPQRGFPDGLPRPQRPRLSGIGYFDRPALR